MHARSLCSTTTAPVAAPMAGRIVGGCTTRSRACRAIWRSAACRWSCARAKASQCSPRSPRRPALTAIHANRHYEYWWREAEEELEQALPDGCELTLHDGNYLMPPGAVKTGSGTPYKIYTPFMRAMLERFPSARRDARARCARRAGRSARERGAGGVEAAAHRARLGGGVRRSAGRSARRWRTSGWPNGATMSASTTPRATCPQSAAPPASRRTSIGAKLRL